MIQIGFWEFCAIAAILSALGAAASAWLGHRREMTRLKLQGKPQQQQSGPEVEEMRQRLEALETKCLAMQEQITDAHMLLADERRALDKKLAESFPNEVDEPRTRDAVRSKTVM